MSAKCMTAEQVKTRPTEGQSHRCEAKVWENAAHDISRSCANIVSNSSDHCAAGHRNKIRRSAGKALKKSNRRSV